MSYLKELAAKDKEAREKAAAAAKEKEERDKLEKENQEFQSRLMEIFK
jgi:cell shape-determining protein MreC